MVVHVSGIAVYVACCLAAAATVALGVLAPNIAMLGILVVMVGVCCIPGRRK